MKLLLTPISGKKTIKIRTRFKKKKKKRNSIIAVSNLSAMKKFQNAVSFDHVIVFIKFHHL